MDPPALMHRSGVRSVRLRIPLRGAKYWWIFGASWINRFRKRSSASPRSILIAKFDGMGDFFLLLPHLKHLRDAGYCVTVAGNAVQREILDHCGLDIDTIAVTTESVAAVRASIARVRRLCPAVAINLSMNVWGAILVNQSRAGRMIGLLQETEQYRYKGARLLFDRTFSWDPAMHGFEVLGRLFAGLFGLPGIEPRLSRPASAGTEIAVHPYARWKPRQWPGFIGLIERLTRAGERLVLLGTPAEHRNGTIAARAAACEGCRVVAPASVSHLLGEIERCRCFVGNDSGPAHYAALIGKRTFVLWGPGNFSRVRQLGPDVRFLKKEIDCRPCRQRGEPCRRGRNECLAGIAADEVSRAVIDIPAKTEEGSGVIPA